MYQHILSINPSMHGIAQYSPSDSTLGTGNAFPCIDRCEVNLIDRAPYLTSTAAASVVRHFASFVDFDRYSVSIS